MRFLIEAPPPEVDRTPRQVVAHFDPVTVSRYEGGPRNRRIPVILVPALMIKPYLFDLRPGTAWPSSCYSGDSTSSWWTLECPTRPTPT